MIEEEKNGVGKENPLCTETEYPLLSKVDSPADLKRLPAEDMLPLCAEIRRFLVEHVSKTGGHLASNLGVTELSVALHRVFSAPEDHILWDVSHQAYVHKILTGRRDRFDTLRTPGGLSGFTRREESEYDCFGAGHSSTSLSAAIGFAEADKLQGKQHWTVAVIGDGAFTGGMIHEALNNCRRDLRMIIVLNENEMSISQNIGRFAHNLSKIRTRPGYFRIKRKTARVLLHIPLIGKGLFSAVKNLKQFFKNALYGSNYFENLGFYYIGPIDGNDYSRVETALREAKKTDENVLIHIKTKKGKGYAPAEENPSLFHSVRALSPNPPPKSEEQKKTGNDSLAEPVVHKEHNFSTEMGMELTRLASKESTFPGKGRLCAITAAMGIGTGLEPFAKAFPERYFDVGIAEEHALTFAAGLAANGELPVVPIYSTFLQRGYDNIVHDIALQKLPVVLCVDRAGLNPSDGATHHGIFDVSFLSAIPGIAIYTPITFSGLHLAMREALKRGAPSAIRYPNACEDEEIVRHFYPGPAPETISVRADYDPGDDISAVIVTHGRIAREAIRAEELLKGSGIRAGILLCEYIKPYDRLAREVARLLPEKKGTVLFLEEEIRSGGFGVSLSDHLADLPGMEGRKRLILAPDETFVIPKAGETVWEAAGIDAASIAARIRNA